MSDFSDALLFFSSYINSNKINFTTGQIMKSSVPSKIKSITMKKPYGSREEYFKESSFGNNPMTMREPSKGGMGIRLKTPRTTLIMMRLKNKKSGTNERMAVFLRRLK